MKLKNKLLGLLALPLIAVSTVSFGQTYKEQKTISPTTQLLQIAEQNNQLIYDINPYLVPTGLFNATWPGGTDGGWTNIPGMIRENITGFPRRKQGDIDKITVPAMSITFSKRIFLNLMPYVHVQIELMDNLFNGSWDRDNAIWFNDVRYSGEHSQQYVKREFTFKLDQANSTTYQLWRNQSNAQRGFNTIYMTATWLADILTLNWTLETTLGTGTTNNKANILKIKNPRIIFNNKES